MENENMNNKKDVAKEKIILFVIGVFLGAVISTAAFFVYTKTLGTSNSSSTSGQMQGGGTPPEMPSGDNSGNGQGGTPPEKPSEENS
ncbi:hypothetical protein IJG92_00455 [Candidatus Saccharibacteria bacterium]|nr:hypothetical protein [Candidatus Saccharibacteria bacterium]